MHACLIENIVVTARVYVVQLYGVGFSPILGWYTAMEYVPFTLTDKIFRKVSRRNIIFPAK